MLYRVSRLCGAVWYGCGVGVVSASCCLVWSGYGKLNLSLNILFLCTHSTCPYDSLLIQTNVLSTILAREAFIYEVFTDSDLAISISCWGYRGIKKVENW